VFERNVAELKAAGAIISDPIVIPNLKALLSRRANNPDGFEAGLKIYLARNPDSNIKSRQDIADSPELAKSFPPTKADQWRRPASALDAARYLDYLGAREELMFTVLKVMADQKLDAIVHKTVEHQPTFIKDGINPPYSSNKGVPTWNTFLVYHRQSADWHHLLRSPVQRANLDKAGLCLRAGNASPAPTRDNTTVTVDSHTSPSA
jgi:amidase